ncbi:hypothetical protein J32TS6_05040 [Virgibacillus pantothenticus]|uniref:Uncharacterized protein n=1 Tax=Virgibacillus pantothenticus TaxID=1473 RepID=A0A0L0QKE3_VIRPA|nr:hypothetical protein [Virgibacillus pantothenticus]KNE19047.1 hypothetical protein AFK71_10825 [Virgibacillus pantothenticus]MED3738972.1 hypothetical protein [Virgibacillus pantothenticus]QTY15488.1 hypothetical protein KBP50_16585 [Virgibacillus pantothenticus]SIT16601.1 hypothetical protein SAMN05421787_12714 [Virgibacillus pantothenticus]GIP61949.1 hypothetical protein J32TS6_05040 [Virgibacillus pantothenticus]
MNINKLNETIKQIGLFLWLNLTGLLFLIGLGTIVYGFYRINLTAGVFALGTVTILIALILAKERG